MSSTPEREIIGNLIGVTRPDIVNILIDPKVTRTKPIEIGEYIVIEYPSPVLTNDVLAIVTNINLENYVD